MRLVFVVLAAVTFALSSTLAAAEPMLDTDSAQAVSAPMRMRVDGVLLASDGSPRTGNVLLVISVYAGQTDTSSLWSEQQLVTLDQNGGFAIMAGASLEDGIPKEHFISGGARWLGVAVQGEAEQPRVEFMSVPYALKAVEADALSSNAITGFAVNDDFKESVRSILQSEGVRTSGDVGTATTTDNYIAKFSGGVATDSAMQEIGGKVGIGTTPWASFTVAGPVYASDSTFHPQASASESATFRGNSTYPGTGSNIAVFENTTGQGCSGLHIYTAAQFVVGLQSREPCIAGSSRPLALQASGGNVGIGTVSPTVKLDVAGDGHFSGSVVVDGNLGAKYQDVAEWVESSETLEAGTVVIVDPVAPNQVLAASRAYDTRVAGAVSAQPGLLLGEASATKAMVAQSGRVKVKVDAKYGAIKIGDLLVTSPTPGHAMRSRPLRIGDQSLHRPGTLVGKALEALPKGKGEILVLLTLQ
jgi:hypothetical protein